MALPKHLWRYALGAALAAALVAGVFLVRKAPAQEARLPDLTLTTLGGTEVRLSDFRGKPLVLNAWATWCPPCRRELPMMVRLAQENPEVRFAFVSQGEGPLVVKNFWRKGAFLPSGFFWTPRPGLPRPWASRGFPPPSSLTGRGGSWPGTWGSFPRPCFWATSGSSARRRRKGGFPSRPPPF